MVGDFGIPIHNEIELKMDLSDTRCPGAVIFDMDGVILDSNETWDAVMGELFAAHGKSLNDLDPDAFVGGDNSLQWAAYLKKMLSVPLSEEEIVARVVTGIISHFSEAVPLIPGAAEALARSPLAIRSGWPVPRPERSSPLFFDAPVSGDSSRPGSRPTMSPAGNRPRMSIFAAAGCSG